MSENHMLLSIIIPAYNVEAYIIDCLDSICTGQEENPSLEVLVVDDGSTDSTLALVSDYATRHSMVHFLHQENGGQTKARRSGILASSGAYLMFVDADDCLVPGFLQQITGLISKHDADIYMYNISAMSSDGSSIQENRSQVFADGFVDRYEICQNLVSTTYMNSLCNKVYRRELIQNHPEAFSNFQVRIGEDLLSNLDLLLDATSFYYKNLPGYCYRANQASVTYDFSKHSIRDYNQMEERILALVRTWGMDDDSMMKQFYQFYLYQLSRELLYCASVSRDNMVYYEDALSCPYFSDAMNQLHQKAICLPLWKRIQLQLLEKRRLPMLNMLHRCLRFAL